MMGIGLPEAVVVLVIALMVFDVKSLPKIARSLGRAIAEFKKAQRSVAGEDSDKLAG